MLTKSKSTCFFVVVVQVILISWLDACNGRPSVTGLPSSSVIADADTVDRVAAVTVDSSGSGGSQFPAPLRLVTSAQLDDNDGNEISQPSSSRVVKRSLGGGDLATPDFKSLVHGLEAQDSQSSNEGVGLGMLPVGSGVVAAEGSPDINQLTNLIATSLNALKSAAELASNSSAYLQDMLTTVQQNTDGIVQQVAVLKNLSVELGKEVAKPLRAIEPFVEAQIEIAQTIRTSVLKIGDQVLALEESLASQLLFTPIILLSSLASNLVSLIMLMCLLCTCVNMKRLRRSQEDICSQRPSTYSTLPFAFRNVEMDDMNMRNSLRTHL